MAENNSIRNIMQIIDDIEDYIGSCKYKAFSNSEILVNKEEMDLLLADLRKNTPPEIKKYQAMLSNKEQIIAEAKIKAKELIEKTKAETNELISQHEIMLQAYEQADGVVNDAIQRAQEIMDNATLDANELKTSAMAYTDSLLAQVEEIVGHYINLTNDRYDDMMRSLNECYDVVRDNRAELLNTAVDDTGVDVESFLSESTEVSEAAKTGSKSETVNPAPAQPAPALAPDKPAVSAADGKKGVSGLDSDDFINLDLI